MALFPSPWRMISSGIRSGDRMKTLLGALLAAWILARRFDGPKRSVIYRQKLRPGDGVMLGAVGRKRQRRR